jgi:cytochrome P450
VAFGAVAGFELDQAQMDQVTDYALTVQRGLFAAPINFPGTFFAKALSTKQAYMNYLESLLRARYEINAETGGIILPPIHEGNMCGTTASIQEMIELGEVPKPEALVHKLMVNAVGASETTGGIMFSSILASAYVEGMIPKLRAEQREVISKHGPVIDYDTLQSMSLLDAVVREACRVIPSAHVLFRILLDDLDLDGAVLPRGSKLILPLPLFAALDEASSGGEPLKPDGSLPTHIDHRDLERSFQPEKHWMEGKPRPLLPVFGYGTHACLGQSVAIAELKITLALMCRKGTWTFEGQGRPSFQFLPMLRLNSGPALVKFTLDPL